MRLLTSTAAVALAFAGTLTATTTAGAVPTTRWDNAGLVKGPRTTVPPRTTPLPLYEFVKTGSGSFPWTAVSLAAVDGGATLVAGPRTAVSGNGALSIVAFATKAHTIGVVSVVGSTTSYVDLVTAIALPPTADAPVPFFDGEGRLNLVYLASNGHVMLVVDTSSSATAAMGPAAQFRHAAWIVRDLTNATGVVTPGGVAVTGEVAAVANNASDLFAVRTKANQLVVLTVADRRPFAVTAVTNVAANVLISSNPVVVGAPREGVATFAAISSTNHVDVFRQSAPETWTTSDLTQLIKAPTLIGELAAAATSSAMYVAGSSLGSADVQLDSYSYATNKWSNVNLTRKTASQATPGPALAGRLAVTLGGGGVSVAGPAAGWGDLFNYSNSSGSWTATDVSATGGSAARTVGSSVAAVTPKGFLTFFAGGVTTPAPPGVGIYDIPSADLPHAVRDGWPILGDTGGLGTQSAPWVNVPSSGAVSTSNDFLVGKAIQNAHKRETWLSFWTVSGPGAGQNATPAGFHANGFAAGAAVAATIDKYAANGVSVKPDWLILDPEGYPDNHSQLDGFDVSHITGNGSRVVVTTSSNTALATGNTVSLWATGISALNVSNATITVIAPNQFSFPSTLRPNLWGAGRVTNNALLVAGWSSIMDGWRAGLASVDPSLKGAIYTEESQYTAANITASSMPVFMAIAWGVGGNAPQPIPHGSNVLGFVEFGNVCTPGQVHAQLAMFASPPWNGRYNTVQFNPPGYCTPTTP